MCAELPRRSRAAYAVQQNCVYLPLSYNKKHSSVDVTSIQEVNHVKIMCYVIDLCVVFICCMYQLFHEPCLQLMYVCVIQLPHYRNNCMLKSLSTLYKSLPMFQFL